MLEKVWCMDMEVPWDAKGKSSGTDQGWDNGMWQIEKRITRRGG